MATAPGRGGVAVVRVSGPAAFRIASEVTGRAVDSSMAGRFFRSSFHEVGASGAARPQPMDDGLVLVFAAPRSYTGEDVVELQGHGGAVAPRRVLEACLAAGARLARRGEFTLRAFLNGRLDLGMAEAVIDLVDARTERAADDAAARLMGAASRPLEEMYAAAIELSSRMEHALDFSEDELPEDFAAAVSRDVARLASLVERKLSTAREGRILREGALVVLCGRPNAGKSSLMNALLGEGRAIVSDEAGTTRDTIEEGAEIGGWPVRLVDTAGLREAEGEVEREGVRRAEAILKQADVVLHVIESGDSRPPPPEIPPDAVRVVSKCDLLGVCPSNCQSMHTSARTGEGLDVLKKAIVARLGQIAAKSAEETGADITTRQREALASARTALASADSALDADEWTIAANELRSAAEALGRLLGKVYSDDLLDALFSRFCVGK